mgnify:FL=1
MAGVYDGAVQELIDELGRLPGVGPKSAQRIAFHVLAEDPEEVKALASALLRVKEKVRFCEICGNVTETEVCSICTDPRRMDSVICVVEESKDIVAIERTREYRGRYHVLGGSINPIQGVGPDDLRIRELISRLSDGAVAEVIIATDPNIEGEATAAYLIRILSSIGVAVSRLASGLPVGGDLEYADEITLSRAFEGRQRILAQAAPGAPDSTSAQGSSMAQGSSTAQSSSAAHGSPTAQSSLTAQGSPAAQGSPGGPAADARPASGPASHAEAAPAPTTPAEAGPGAASPGR